VATLAILWESEQAVDSLDTLLLVRLVRCYSNLKKKSGIYEIWGVSNNNGCCVPFNKSIPLSAADLPSNEVFHLEDIDCE
jgi:hypothetical protein